MASHAYTTTPLLRPAPSDRWGLLPTGSKRRPGPVTVALRAMHAADPDRQRLAELRRAIADRIETDIALLDRLDGDPDFEADHVAIRCGLHGLYSIGVSSDDEPSLCGLDVAHPSVGGDDREEGDDNGIVDFDGAREQGFRGYGRCE